MTVLFGMNIINSIEYSINEESIQKPNPATTYTPSTDTNCIGNVCNMIMYSTIKNVYEDDRWKRVEDARSLKNSGIECIVKSDGVNLVECLDWNYTSVSLKLNQKGLSILNKDVPLRIYYPITNETGETNLILKSETIERFNLFSNEKNKEISNFKYGDIIHFGDTSTVVTITGATNFKDAYILSNAKNQNTGGSATFIIGATSAGANRRSLIKITNISSTIGAGNTILSANLYLYCEGEASGSNDNVGLYRSLKEWYEGNNDLVDPSGDLSVTWNDWRNDAKEWGQEGAENICNPCTENTVDGGGDDRSLNAYATTTITNGNAWFSLNVNSSVQNWYNGSWSEYGWVFINSNEASINTRKTFTSSQGASNQPYLNITYIKNVYPTFSNYWDNNNTLNGNGIGSFNVTLLNTNGTVWLEINNTNYTAINATASVYNVSVSFTTNGNYPYRWYAWGNGTDVTLLNNSGTRNYFIPAYNSPPIVLASTIFSSTSTYLFPLIGYSNLTDSTDNSDIQKVEYKWYNNSMETFNGTIFKRGSISAGNVHTCGIRANDSRVLCWGYGTYGVLGDGNIATHNVSNPTLTLDTSAYLSVSTGRYFTCGIRANDSRILCWGYGNLGYLGDGDNTLHYVSIPNLTQDTSPYESISTGNYHVCGVRSNDSRVLCWGSGQYGQLGDGNTGVHNVSTPNLIVDTCSYSFVNVGDYFTCGIRKYDSRVLCWGYGGSGRLGDGNLIASVGIPNLTLDTNAYSSINIRGDNTCGIRANDSRVLCWGSGQYGELGNGTNNINLAIPTLTQDTSPYESISTGNYHTCGIRSNDSRVLCWGLGDNGRLGDGNAGSHNVNIPNLTQDTSAYLRISVGDSQSCGIRINDSRVLCWGRGNLGILGDGINIDHDTVIPNITTSNSAYSSFFTNNKSSQISIIDKQFLKIGDNWTFSSRGNDGVSWSNWTNSSELTIKDSCSPIIQDSCNSNTSYVHDYGVNCADSCTVSSNFDVEGYDLSIIGAGIVTITANITNWNSIFLKGDSTVDKCTIKCIGGCFKKNG